MKRAFIYAIAATWVLLTLSGCSSHSWAPINSVDDYDDVTCKSYGFIYGGPDYERCRHYLATQQTKRPASLPPGPARP
jgi:hypothetical protein